MKYMFHMKATFHDAAVQLSLLATRSTNTEVEVLYCGGTSRDVNFTT